MTIIPRSYYVVIVWWIFFSSPFARFLLIDGAVMRQRAACLEPHV